MEPMDAARNIFLYALDAVLPKHLLERRIRRSDDALVLGNLYIDLKSHRKVYIIGAGKASAAMTSVLEFILGGNLTDGICVVKYGHTVPLKKVRLREAGHPIPDENGARAGEEILELAGAVKEGDIVFCLISGGGSALLVSPQEGITLKDKQELSTLLLRAGANIHELNTVRKHLSRIKGGRLAEHLARARIISLLISDVIGDSLDVIASGPTVPDPSTYGEALNVLEKYDLMAKAPASVTEILTRGARGEVRESPKPGNALFANVSNWIIGNNQFALKAAAEKSRLLGYTPCIVSSCMFGETRHIAHSLVAMAREVIKSGNPVRRPACLIMGGETTVTVKGEGKGGRCTEFALSAAMAMNQSDRFAILAAGTDGTDGPTDAAGAIVNGETISNALKSGFDPVHYLENNDSYTLFKQTGNLLVTGPTLTNVMDIMIAVIP